LWKVNSSVKISPSIKIYHFILIQFFSIFTSNCNPNYSEIWIVQLILQNTKFTHSLLINNINICYTINMNFLKKKKAYKKDNYVYRNLLHQHIKLSYKIEK